MDVQDEQRGRLCEFIASKQVGSINKFSQEIGVAQTTLNRQAKGVQPITAKIMYQLVSRFPELSLNWLVAGKGTMCIDECASNELDTIKIRMLTDENEALTNKVARMEQEIKALERELEQRKKFIQELMEKVE